MVVVVVVVVATVVVAGTVVGVVGGTVTVVVGAVVVFVVVVLARVDVVGEPAFEPLVQAPTTRASATKRGGKEPRDGTITRRG